MVTVEPQNHPAPVKDAPATEPTQKKSTGTTGGSQLRIPSSINNSKGSLAEFAAQVSIYMNGVKLRTRLTPVPTDDVFVLVREVVEVTSHRRSIASSSFPCRRSDSLRWISEMGCYDSLDHTGQPECDSAGTAVHLPAEEVQFGREGKERQ